MKHTKSTSEMSSKETITEDDSTIYFYRPQHRNGEFSQWWLCRFTCPSTNITYTSCEQYMMHRKALLFSPSHPITAEILATDRPSLLIKLGRKIPNFNQKIWERERQEIVTQGNYLKFSQDEGLRLCLLATGERELVEASPSDRIWGVGFSAKEAERMRDSAQWGLNLLGKALMEVRERMNMERMTECE